MQNNDNKNLMELQERYKNGDVGALGLMYLQCRRIAERMIRDQRLKKGFFLSQQDIKEKAHNAAAYIISRYKKKQDFEIRESFTAYIYLRIRHELYYRRKVDGIVDFVNLDDLNQENEI